MSSSRVCADADCTEILPANASQRRRYCSDRCRSRAHKRSQGGQSGSETELARFKRLYAEAEEEVKRLRRQLGTRTRNWHEAKARQAEWKRRAARRETLLTRVSEKSRQEIEDLSATLAEAQRTREAHGSVTEQMVAQLRESLELAKAHANRCADENRLLRDELGEAHRVIQQINDALAAEREIAATLSARLQVLVPIFHYWDYLAGELAELSETHSLTPEQDKAVDFWLRVRTEHPQLVDWAESHRTDAPKGEKR